MTPSQADSLDKEDSCERGAWHIHPTDREPALQWPKEAEDPLPTHLAMKTKANPSCRQPRGRRAREGALI